MLTLEEMKEKEHLEEEYWKLRYEASEFWKKYLEPTGSYDFYVAYLEKTRELKKVKDNLFSKYKIILCTCGNLVDSGDSCEECGATELILQFRKMIVEYLAAQSKVIDETEVVSIFSPFFREFEKFENMFRRDVGV